MPKKKNTQRATWQKALNDMGPFFSVEEQEKIKRAFLDYQGDMTVFESAIGSLFIAKVCGWKVVRLVHSGSIYKKYQDILGIQFSEVAAETTEISTKSIGYNWTVQVNAFWKAARGQISVPDRKNLSASNDIVVD